MLIASVRLQPKHLTSGKTKHWIGGAEMSRPLELRIESDKETSGFYLFYCDSKGPMTDTWHLSLDDAFHQAEFEFLVRREEWTMLS